MNLNYKSDLLFTPEIIGMTNNKYSHIIFQVFFLIKNINKTIL